MRAITSDVLTFFVLRHFCRLTVNGEIKLTSKLTTCIYDESLLSGIPALRVLFHLIFAIFATPPYQQSVDTAPFCAIVITAKH